MTTIASEVQDIIREFDEQITGDETAPTRDVRCPVTARTIMNGDKAEMGKSEKDSE